MVTKTMNESDASNMETPLKIVLKLIFAKSKKKENDLPTVKMSDLLNNSSASVNNESLSKNEVEKLNNSLKSINRSLKENLTINIDSIVHTLKEQYKKSGKLNTTNENLDTTPKSEPAEVTIKIKVIKEGDDVDSGSEIKEITDGGKNKDSDVQECPDTRVIKESDENKEINIEECPGIKQFCENQDINGRDGPEIKKRCEDSLETQIEQKLSVSTTETHKICENKGINDTEGPTIEEFCENQDINGRDGPEIKKRCDDSLETQIEQKLSVSTTETHKLDLSNSKKPFFTFVPKPEYFSPAKVENDTRVAQLVRDLVEEKFKETINQRLKKKERPKSGVLTETIEKESRITTTRPGSTDSGINIPEEPPKTENIEYDEHKFLREALGDLANSYESLDKLLDVSSQQNMFNVIKNSNTSTPISTSHASIPYSMRTRKRARNNLSKALNSYEEVLYMPSVSTISSDRTVGTHEISTLVSHTDCSAMYSTIQKPKRKNPPGPKDFSIANQSRYPSYEEITFDYPHSKHSQLSISKVETLQRETFIQNEIISQISKALTFLKVNKHNYGTAQHLEAEKILLISSLKKTALEQAMSNQDSQQIGNTENYGTISIKSINFHFRKSDADNPALYICVAQCGTKIITSKITEPRKNELEFDDEFVFDKLSSDFKIKLEIFALELNSDYNHSCISSPTNMFTLKRGKKDDGKNLSSFKSLGETVFTITNIKNNVHVLNNTPVNDCVLEKFTANIDYQLVLKTCIRGFLTVGTLYRECPVWNRRWCVLDGASLTCYNYPSDEGVSRPVSNINLENCTSDRVNFSDRKYCFKSKPLVVETVKYNVRTKYFLAPDNNQDMHRWKTSLDSVLTTLHNWQRHL